MFVDDIKRDFISLRILNDKLWTFAATNEFVGATTKSISVKCIKCYTVYLEIKFLSSFAKPQRSFKIHYCQKCKDNRHPLKKG